MRKTVQNRLFSLYFLIFYRKEFSNIQMLFVFPGLTYMTTMHTTWLQPNLAHGWEVPKLFPTKPPECVTARWCMQTVAGSDHLHQLSTRVGTGVWTQDLSDESLAPYRSELSGQPTILIYVKYKKGLKTAHGQGEKRPFHTV